MAKQIKEPWRDTAFRPAQPANTPQYRKLRDDAERELLSANPPVPDAVTFRTLRNGTRIRFRRFGTTKVVGHHIYYGEE